MAPSEGDRINRFAAYSRTPQGMSDLESSDEEESKATPKVTNKDTIDDVISSTSTPCKPPPTLPSDQSDKESPKDTMGTIPMIESPSRQEPTQSWADTAEEEDREELLVSASRGEQTEPAVPSSDGTVEADDDRSATNESLKIGNPPSSNIQAETSEDDNGGDNEAQTMEAAIERTPTAATTPNKSVRVLSSILEQEWVGTLVEGKAAKRKSPRRNNLTSIREEVVRAAREREIELGTPKTKNGATRKPNESHATLRETDCGTVRYEVRRKARDSSYNPHQELKELLHQIQLVDPDAYLESIKDKKKVIRSAASLPHLPAQLTAFFETRTSKSDDYIKVTIAFKVKSAKSLQELKEAEDKMLLNFLRKTEATLVAHRFPSLAMEKIGWLSMKSTLLSLEGIHDVLVEEIVENGIRSNNGKIQHANDIPLFEMILIKVAENNSRNARVEPALGILCQETDGETLKKLFIGLPMNVDRYGAFMLLSNRRKKPATHESMVVRHRRFRQQTWTMTVVGLEWGLLGSRVNNTNGDGTTDLRTAIMESGNGILAIDEAITDKGGPTKFVFTVPREMRQQATDFVNHDLWALASTAEEYENRSFHVEERGKSLADANDDILTSWFPHVKGSPQKRQYHNAENESSTLAWSEFPILQPPESPPPASHIPSYRQAVLKPAPRSMELQTSLSPLAQHTVSSNRGSRHSRTTSTKKTAPTRTTTITPPLVDERKKDAALHLPLDIELEMASLAGDCETTAPSMAASYHTALTEVSRQLTTSNELLTVTQIALTENRAELAEMKALNSAQSEQIQQIPETIKASLEVHSQQMANVLQQRDVELLTARTQLENAMQEVALTKAKVEEIKLSMTRHIDTSQETLLQHLLSNRTSQDQATEKLTMLLCSQINSVQQSLEEMKEKKSAEQAIPMVLEQPKSTPMPQTIQTNVSDTTVSTLTPNNTRTTNTAEATAPGATQAMAIEIIESPLRTDETGSGIAETILSKRDHTHKATPLVSDTPSPNLPTKRQCTSTPESVDDAISVQPVKLEMKTGQSTTTGTPETLFASTTSIDEYQEGVAQQQLDDPLLHVNDPEVAAFQWQEEASIAWAVEAARADRELALVDKSPLKTQDDWAIESPSESISIATAIKQYSPRRHSFPHPTTLDDVSKVLFDTTPSTCTTTSASTTTATTAPCLEAGHHDYACRGSKKDV